MRAKPDGAPHWIFPVAAILVLLGLLALLLAQPDLASMVGADPKGVAQGAAAWVTVGALMLALLLVAWGWRQQRLQARRWRRLQAVSDAVHWGSVRLAEAVSTGEVVSTSLDMLARLSLAPNLAYLAYHQGSPQILGGRGAFGPLVGQPIFPNQRDSRSVQADHWMIEEALMRLPRTERLAHLVAEVYGHGGRHVGNLVLTRPSTRRFSPEDAQTVEMFARLMGAQLGQFQAIAELEEGQDLLLRTLGNMLEHRDNETAGHTGRVVSLSVRLGEALGWNESRLTALRWGAYLHDIGKIATPDAILHKPGRLTPAERQIMEDHARVGYDLLQDVHFLPSGTLDLVRYHHEKWNGSGYPAGLRGQEIPDTARIFAIVDVYDALTSARPYKRAWTVEETLAELQEQAGKHFDPEYVRVFAAMMREDGGARLLEE